MGNDVCVYKYIVYISISYIHYIHTYILYTLYSVGQTAACCCDNRQAGP